MTNQQNPLGSSNGSDSASGGGNQPDQLFNVLGKVNKLRRQAATPAAAPAAAPYLLSRIANHLGFGSHGGWMTQANDEDAKKSLEIKVTIPETDPPTEANTNGESDPVHVFILDTFPDHIHTLQAQFPYDPVRHRTDDHTYRSLLSRVLNYNSQYINVLTTEEEGYVFPDDHDHANDPTLNHAHPNAEVVAEGHNHAYPPMDVSDHGLSIAGTIRSIAPNSYLHLVKIMNRYGVGTLGSLLAGLEHVRQVMKSEEMQGKRFVVNLSLAFGLTPETVDLLHQKIQASTCRNGECLTEEEKKFLYLLTHIKDDINESIRRARAELFTIRDMIDDVQRVLREITLKAVFAASGNYDAGPQGLGMTPMRFKSLIASAAQQATPEALWPAREGDVTGVGALKKDMSIPQFAHYSHSADVAPWQGLYTLGGDFNPNDPPGSVDTSGHLLALSGKKPYVRWWAGTSVATAIITGTVAKFMAEGHGDYVDLRDRLKTLDANGVQYLEAEQPLTIPAAQPVV